jgi:hypothetical protein
MGRRLSFSIRRLLTSILVSSVALPAGPARAVTALKLESGWSVATDGFVNAFLVDETGDARPAGVDADAFYGRPNDQGNFRVRTGFLPSKLGFTFGAPEAGGVKVQMRVAMYPQINNGGSRTSISPNIDFREFYFTADGSFGQVLMGRALNLFQQGNILSDMSLFGVGVPGAGLPAGPTLGHVGFGYLYPSFGAQLRYTTPALSGLKLAVAISDPSNIAGGGVNADITPMPTFEAEASWSMKTGAAALRAWVDGLYEQAKYAAGATTASVTAAGVAAGVGAGFSGLDVVVSGFTGKGLGTTTEMDVDALDATGKERTVSGVLGQATYTFAGKTKIGASYGRTMAKQTDAEKAAGGSLDNRQAITAGVYHDVTSWMKIVGEYTNAKLTWFTPAGSTASAPTQSSNIVGAGMLVFW